MINLLSTSCSPPWDKMIGSVLISLWFGFAFDDCCIMLYDTKQMPCRYIIWRTNLLYIPYINLRNDSFNLIPLIFFSFCHAFSFPSLLFPLTLIFSIPMCVCVCVQALLNQRKVNFNVLTILPPARMFRGKSRCVITGKGNNILTDRTLFWIG